MSEVKLRGEDVRGEHVRGEGLPGAGLHGGDRANTTGALRQLQGETDAGLQQAVGRVRARCAGRDEDEVYNELLRELKVVFPAGFQPNGVVLRRIAQGIAEGPADGTR